MSITDTAQLPTANCRDGKGWEKQGDKARQGVGLGWQQAKGISPAAAKHDPALSPLLQLLHIAFQTTQEHRTRSYSREAA